MKKHFYIILYCVLLFISLNSCKNLYETFEEPSIEIISTTILSKDSCSLVLRIDKGVGARFKDSYLSFADITDTTQKFSIGFTIPNIKVQTDTFTVNVKTQRAYHDYRISAVLVSQKNLYESIPQVIHLSQNYYEQNIGISSVDLVILPLEFLYSDIGQGIGVTIKKGGRISLTINYTKSLPADCKYEVKLNDSLSFIPEMSFGGSLSGFCQITLPDDIKAGDYTVALYANGQKFMASSKVRILPGSSIISNIPAPPISWYYYTDLYTSFNSGNKFYYLYRQPDHSVIMYDFSSQTWTKKNNIQFPVNYNQLSWVLPCSFTYQTTHYIVVRLYNDLLSKIDSLEIWKYDEANDSWSVEARYPGKAIDNLFTFVVGDKLYMGGGVIMQVTDIATDFWAYDFTTKTWKQQQNLPYTMAQNAIASCSSPNQGFVFTRYRELYQYDPGSDNWEMLNTLKGGATYRVATALLYNNGKLYVVGGDTYTPITMGDVPLCDTWEYNLDTNDWTIRDVFNAYPYLPFISLLPTFFYNGQIYVGFCIYDPSVVDHNRFFIEINP